MPVSLASACKVRLRPTDVSWHATWHSWLSSTGVPQSTSPYAFALDQRLNSQAVLAGAGRHDAERHSERQVCLIDLKMMLARLTCSPWRMPGAHLRHSDIAECPACVNGLHCCSRAQVHMPACAHLHAVGRKRSHLPLLAQARCPRENAAAQWRDIRTTQRSAHSGLNSPPDATSYVDTRCGQPTHFETG